MIARDADARLSHGRNPDVLKPDIAKQAIVSEPKLDLSGEIATHLVKQHGRGELGSPVTAPE
jgi:hypothetical protein